MEYPNIENFKFNPCCKASIKSINDILKAQKMLNALLSLGVLATIFVSPYKGLNDVIITSYSIQSTDFEMFAQALIGLPNFTKHQIKNVCANEVLMKHPYGDLHKFWKTVYNMF